MMMLDLLLATIAATTTAPAPRISPPPPAPPARLRPVCRAELGTASLVRRVPVCHGAAEWRAIDARRRARHLRGA